MEVEEVVSAAREGDVPLLRELLDSSPTLLEARCEQWGGTPLLWASLVGASTDAVRFLLERGAAVGASATNANDRTKKLPLRNVLGRTGAELGLEAELRLK